MATRGTYAGVALVAIDGEESWDESDAEEHAKNAVQSRREIGYVGLGG